MLFFPFAENFPFNNPLGFGEVAAFVVTLGFAAEFDVFFGVDDEGGIGGKPEDGVDGGTGGNPGAGDDGAGDETEFGVMGGVGRAFELFKFAVFLADGVEVTPNGSSKLSARGFSFVGSIITSLKVLGLDALLVLALVLKSSSGIWFWFDCVMLFTPGEVLVAADAVEGDWLFSVTWAWEDVCVVVSSDFGSSPGTSFVGHGRRIANGKNNMQCTRRKFTQKGTTLLRRRAKINEPIPNITRLIPVKCLWPK